MARVRIGDVAKRAGVSITTVSLVLNDAPSRISEDTAKAVRTAAADLGYRPDQTARSLRTRRTRMIGMLSDHIVTTPYAGRMIRGVQEEAWSRDYFVLIGNTDANQDREQDLIDALTARGLEGYLYASMFYRIAPVPSALEGCPVVGLDVEIGSVGPSVVPDDGRGARDATRLLVEAGHRRVAHLAGRESTPAAMLRTTGFRDVLQDAGCYAPELVVPYTESDSESSSDFAEDAAMAMLSSADRPTAIFAFNDSMASGVYRAAARLGLEIPTDLSVVGFDNQELIATEVRPRLTTIALPHEEMGKRATSMLLDMIDGAPMTAEVIRLRCPVVLRDSIAAPSVTVG